MVGFLMPLVTALSPSCVLVRTRGCQVLLLRDDPQRSLPSSESLEQLSSIDGVLVASVEAMAMLPALTEAPGFRGRVVATAAALRLGEQQLLERVALHQAARERSLEVAAAMPEQLHSAADVAACMAKLTAVSFGERVELGCSVHAVAHPSGCGIGAAVWSVQAAGERIVLAGACSPPPEIFQPDGRDSDGGGRARQPPTRAGVAAGASAWLAVSACRPMRPADVDLCGADVLVLGGVQRTAAGPPAEVLRTACAAACDACASGAPRPPLPASDGAHPDAHR